MSDFLKSMRLATGLRDGEILKLVLSAPRRYKVYYIKKRTGGLRQIAQPTPEIKFLQRTFMSLCLERLPIHGSATAYRKGISTLHNAMPHASNGPILKIDLKEFFPSIRSSDWVSYCKKHNIFQNDYDAELSARLLFFAPPGGRLLRLSIGAPSSPMLSNIMMYEFDCEIERRVSKDKVVYTRYADDLTFSAPRTGYLVNVQRDVAETIRAMKYPKLDINSQKTTYITKKYHRSVTGLTLSNDGRVTIGRDQKRNIRASIHSAINGAASSEEISKLSGLLSYVHSVEPAFIEVLEKKYGSETVELIRRYGN
jgi:retron-type reverse transcriptase